jgi:hypothetical protein
MPKNKSSAKAYRRLILNIARVAQHPVLRSARHVLDQIILNVTLVKRITTRWEKINA